MRTLRQLHIFLGVFFAPFLIYFSLSGAWQVFRFNDLPREGTPTTAQKILHALSDTHTHATLPGNDAKTEQSLLFKFFEITMAMGFVITAVLGLKMAFQIARQRRAVIIALVAGTVIPLLFLVFTI
jgi:hypothetical protein